MARLRGAAPAASDVAPPFRMAVEDPTRSGPAPRRPHGTHDRRRAMNSDAFTAYARLLAPTLAPSDIVVLDNLPVHKVSGARQRSSAPAPASCSFRHTPPTSTIDQVFAKIKALLRKAAARTVGCPRSGRRLRPRHVPSRRVRKLLHKLGLRARLIRKCPRRPRLGHGRGGRGLSMPGEDRRTGAWLVPGTQDRSPRARRSEVCVSSRSLGSVETW